MSFLELQDFIKSKMRMSAVYQPVLLKCLLENKGVCHQSVIAKALLLQDPSQVEYYTKITNDMVGRVLRKHKIIERDAATKEYSMLAFGGLSDEEASTLINACEQKISEFMSVRGKSAYEHRRKSAGYISGTIRYEVLKRGRFRCELCGIGAEKKALEVDHIVPRNRGGIDDLSNYQSLCYSCNAMKRDRDSTDFRDWANSYEHRERDCIFCEMEDKRIIADDALSYAIRDGFPVTELHTLIIPRRHAMTYFDLGQSEINSVNRLIAVEKQKIEELDPSVTGFNIGMNCGESAGQTVFHCHIHLIPRRDDDVAAPRGGVRHLIPGKGSY